MVRINLIVPYVLTDQHLIAEYREILSAIRYSEKLKKEEKLPKKDEPMLYNGKNGKLIFNHWRYFSNKIDYLYKRHFIIVQEMKRRGFKTNYTFPNYSSTYKPTNEEVDFLKQRIISRLREKPHFYKYYRKPIDLDMQCKMILGAPIL